MNYYLKVFNLGCGSWVKLGAIISSANVCMFSFFVLLYWPYGSAEGYTVVNFHTYSAAYAILLWIGIFVAYFAAACLLAFILCPLSNCFLRKLGGVRLNVQVLEDHGSCMAELPVNKVLISWWRIFVLGLVLGIGCILLAFMVGVVLWILGMLYGKILSAYAHSVLHILFLIGGGFLVDSLVPKLPSLFGGIRLRGNMVLINPRVREEPVSTKLLGSEKLREVYDAWKSFWGLGRK